MNQDKYPNLRRGPAPGQGFVKDMSPEAKSRRGRIGAEASKTKSPWRSGPMCATPNAGKSFKRYQERGK